MEKNEDIHRGIEEATGRRGSPSAAVRPRSVTGVVKLICLDVDGTLVGSAGEPTAALWASADRARRRGQRLTLCTARLAAGPTRDWAERLDPRGWHVFHTGAALWHPETGAVDAVTLPAGALEACAAVAAERGWVLEAYTWDDYAVDSDAPLAVDHAALLQLPFRRRPLDALEGPVVRAQFVVPDDAVASAVAAAPPGTVASAASSPAMPGAAFVSITEASVSKATGIAKVSNHVDVDLADTMMVGDGHNDIPAIVAVGWGVAMANAEPEVLDAARITAGHVDLDGAADIIDRSVDLG